MELDYFDLPSLLLFIQKINNDETVTPPDVLFHLKIIISTIHNIESKQDVTIMNSAQRRHGSCSPWCYCQSNNLITETKEKECACTEITPCVMLTLSDTCINYAPWSSLRQ